MYAVEPNIWLAMLGGLAGGFVLGLLSGLQACRRERVSLWSCRRDAEADAEAQAAIVAYLTAVLRDPADPANVRRRSAWLARVDANTRDRDRRSKGGDL